MTIVVVESGKLRYGLIADEVHDSEEIVVKPLGSRLQNCHSLAGATILGDGRVALILDVGQIAQAAALRQPDGAPVTEDDRTGIASDLHTILIFSSHPDELFGVPMGMVARIEQYPAQAIRRIGEQEFIEVDDRYLPLISLESLLDARPREDRDRYHVVVFAAPDGDVGLLVPRLIDTRELSGSLQQGPLGAQGLMGSAVIDGRVVRILDGPDLIRRAFPEMASDLSDDANGGRPRILLAEDDPFFIRQIESLLESWGYDVTCCANGRLAWERLDDSPGDFAALVTDIEMPEMNGFELARRVSQDDRLAQTRIIAVTSLQGPEDIRRGLDAGIDDYQMKVDREKLRKALADQVAGRLPPRPCAASAPQEGQAT